MTALLVGKLICCSPLRRGLLFIKFAALRRHLLQSSEPLAIRPVFLLLSTCAALLGAPLVAQEAPGNFVITGSLTTVRTAHTATLLPNGKVLVAGGYNGSSILASAELYDPASGAWSLTGSLAAARTAPAATLLPNGKVLVAGGASADGSVFLASAELYDPASGTWSATGSMATARRAHTATLLPNGKVFVTGGYGSFFRGIGPLYPPWIASAELYDPAIGTWSTTGKPGKGRTEHTATLLPDGNVLVAGGSDGLVLPSAELYDAASGIWSVTGSLVFGRKLHAATLLLNDKVLIAGGWDNSVVVATAELYVTSAPAPTPTPTPRPARHHPPNRHRPR